MSESVRIGLSGSVPGENQSVRKCKDRSVRKCKDRSVRKRKDGSVRKCEDGSGFHNNTPSPFTLPEPVMLFSAMFCFRWWLLSGLSFEAEVVVCVLLKAVGSCLVRIYYPGIYCPLEALDTNIKRSFCFRPG